LKNGDPSVRLKKAPPEFAPHTDDPDGAGRRTVGNLVIEARKFSGLAVDTLVELTKDNYAPSTRYVAATAITGSASFGRCAFFAARVAREAGEKISQGWTGGTPRALRAVACCLIIYTLIIRTAIIILPGVGVAVR
jgi:hypothetical protein